MKRGNQTSPPRRGTKETARQHLTIIEQFLGRPYRAEGELEADRQVMHLGPADLAERLCQDCIQHAPVGLAALGRGEAPIRKPWIIHGAD